MSRKDSISTDRMQFSIKQQLRATSGDGNFLNESNSVSYESDTAIKQESK